MAEKWKTPRRCERCLLHDKTYYLTAQNWGTDKDGRMEYMMDCEKCGWTGKSFWSGHSGFGGMEESQR